MLEPMGLAAGPVVPTREWRELYAALDCAAVAAIHPFYTASFREFEAAGRPMIGSAPVGFRRHRAWLQAIGESCNVSDKQIDAAKQRLPARHAARCRKTASRAASRCRAMKAPSCWSRGCWSKAVRISNMSARPARSRASPPDAASGLKPRRARRVPRLAGAGLAAMAEFKPDLAIGTTPLVQKAKEQATPALYFTNLISARPLMGPPEPARWPQWSMRRSPTSPASTEMTDFFEGVGRATMPVSGKTPRRPVPTLPRSTPPRPPHRKMRSKKPGRQERHDADHRS
jgi:chlorophyllide a reductase subunit Y